MELFLLNSWPSIEKLLIQNVSNFYQQVQKWFWKQEIELSKQEMKWSKQEMELFLLFPDFWSKNFLYKMFLTFKNNTKTCFENIIWNYFNRKRNFCHTRPNLKSNLVWILQVLTCKLGHGMAWLCEGITTHPSTRCYHMQAACWDSLQT